MYPQAKLNRGSTRRSAKTVGESISDWIDAFFNSIGRTNTEGFSGELDANAVFRLPRQYSGARESVV